MANHSNLYVTGLPDGLDEATFRQLFEGYGNIVSLKLFANLNYGFVKFASVEEAETVINELNGSLWGSSTVVVKFANNDQGHARGPGSGGSPQGARPTAGGWSSTSKVDPSRLGADDGLGSEVYVKGLPLSITDDMLFQVFGAYGSVVWHKVLKQKEGAADAVALVQMGSADEAAWLVENLHGNIPQGLTMPVSVTYKNNRRGDRGQSQGGCGGAAGGGGRQESYGRGAATGGGSALGHARYEPYSKGASPPPPPPAAIGAPGFSGGKAFTDFNDGSNLYIKGLPHNTDELYLYKLFAPFGAIQSVKPMVAEWGAIGFVKFANATEAQVAIESLHGQQLPDGSVVQVTVKTAKSR